MIGAPNPSLLNAVLTIPRYAVRMVRPLGELNYLRAVVEVFGLLVFAWALFASQAVRAQSVTTVTTSSTGTINSATTCTSPLVRNFTVSGSFTVSDVDLGVYATHSWRGDLRITLQAPDGTRVQLVDGDPSNAANISGDNFNVRLDDGAGQTVNTDSATGNHSTANPPPFANAFRPNSPLSAFNGKSATGTWRLEICDLYPSADNGSFRYAALYLTSAPTNYADLSLTKTVDDASPNTGGSVTYTVTLRNASSSPQTASNVAVRDLLPLGVVYDSHSGNGTYNPVTGVWSISSIAPGATRTLTVEATVTATAGATIVNIAEVTASSVTDLDSTPNNGVPGEDDYATASFTVSGSRVAGTPPTLSCPNGSVLFDWDGKSWPGSAPYNYALGSLGTMNLALVNPGAWLDNSSLGGQSPTLQSDVTGGLSPAQQSLIQLVNLANRTDVVTTTITLPRAMAGAQFTVFDVDWGSNQFADRITVSGRLNGVAVLPVLTNGVANYVIGNTAYGDASSGNTSNNGNVVVTFATPVDTIVIEYGNHSLAPSDPGQQAISLHDITFCLPHTTLSVTKTSAVISNPVEGTTDAKAIPGALIEYLITVANTGQAAVDAGTVTVTDDVPADAKMCLADLASGSGPVRFVDGSPVSGISYLYSALGSTSDNLQFSNDNGATWTYVPTADGDNCDAAITDFRVTTSGSFVAGASFALQARMRVE